MYRFPLFVAICHHNLLTLQADRRTSCFLLVHCNSNSSTFCVTDVTGNSSLSSLALDSSRNLLYFTDTGSGTVGVLSTDGFGVNSPHLLVAGANEKPKAVAIDTTNRYTKYIMIYCILCFKLQSFLGVDNELVDVSMTTTTTTICYATGCTRWFKKRPPHCFVNNSFKMVHGILRIFQTKFICSLCL